MLVQLELAEITVRGQQDPHPSPMTVESEIEQMYVVEQRRWHHDDDHHRRRRRRHDQRIIIIRSL